MSASIAERLYDWIHERRIMSALAQEMGVKESTLSAELRPNQSSAKLGADSLVPLCQAIRNIGYGKELDGILHEFIMDLRGTNPLSIPDKDLVPHVIIMARGLGVLSSCAAKIPRMNNEAELVQLCTILRTELLPVIMQMDATIDARLRVLRKGKHGLLMDTLIPAFLPESGS
jgi:hypothetical protein